MIKIFINFRGELVEYFTLSRKLLVNVKLYDTRKVNYKNLPLLVQYDWYTATKVCDPDLFKGLKLEIQGVLTSEEQNGISVVKGHDIKVL